MNTKGFRRLAQDEKIPAGAFHSLDEGETKRPILNKETVGQTPADFAKDRSFWVFEPYVAYTLAGEESFKLKDRYFMVKRKNGDWIAISKNGKVELVENSDDYLFNNFVKNKDWIPANFIITPEMQEKIDQA